MPTRTRTGNVGTAPPPPLRPPAFVGRERELATLTAALAHPPAVVLIGGEAGVGKSRLVRELLAAQPASAPGARRTLVAVCPPYREPHTLGPVVDALRLVTTGVAGLRLSGLAGTLRPLFPEWAADLPPAPEPLHDARAARHRLFRALAELVDRLDIAVLVVEDVHWADDATLELLLFLAARPTAAPSLLVTYRPEDLPGDSLLLRLSSRQPAGSTQRRLDLTALGPEQTARLVSSMLAGEQISDDFAAFLHRHTAGLPLAVEESVRLMYDRADLTRQGRTWLRRKLDRIEVPPTVRDAILERAGRLSADARLVLEAAAVLTDPTDVATLAPVAPLTVDGTRAALAEVLAAGLLHEDDRGLLAFRHTLATRAVYEMVPPLQRRGLHRRAAQVLEGRSPLPVARLARHFREGGDNANWCRYAEQAADLALASGDETTAATLLYDLLRTTELAAESVPGLVDKVPYAPFTGSAQFDVLTSALRRALDTGRLTGAVRARARFQLGRVLLMVCEDEAGRVELKRAVEELPADSLEAARAMVMLGRPDAGTGSASAHLAWLQRSAEVTAAMTDADRLNLTVQRASALLTLGEDMGWEQAARIPDDGPDALLRQHVTRGHLNMGDAAMRWGRYPEAGRRLAMARELAERHELLAVRDAVVATRLYLDWYTGAWSGLAERATGLAEHEGLSPTARLEARVVAALAVEAVGTRVPDADLVSIMADTHAAGLVEMYAEFAAVLARRRLAAGDPAGARRVTDGPMDLVAGKGIWLWAVDLAPARVDALVAVGRVEEAGVLVRVFGDWLGSRDIPVARAAVVRCQAALAEAGRRHREAAALFGRSADVWRALPRPYDALLDTERMGRCLVTAGVREEGLAVLADAQRGLADLGAGADAERVLRIVQGLGTPVRPPGRGGRPSYGDNLSPRELDVVRLLIAGRTNREIAQVLVVAVDTVTSHVRSAMRKLRVSSRTALAVTAMERGIVSGNQPSAPGDGTQTPSGRHPA